MALKWYGIIRCHSSELSQHFRESENGQFGTVHAVTALDFMREFESDTGRSCLNSDV
jgi:hypothetical protein